MANPNPVLKLDSENFTRDEVAMMYTALFYITNGQGVLPVGHPPTPAQTGQLKLAKVLDEDVPEAAMQDVQRQLNEAQDLAARRQAMRQDVEQRAAEEARRAQEEAEAAGRPMLVEAEVVEEPEAPVEGS